MTLPKIGYSTGAIGRSDFAGALTLLAKLPVVEAVELSALRREELPILAEALPGLDLRRYAYVSLHAPSKFPASEEPEIVATLEAIVSRYGWNVVVHVDTIHDPTLWHPFGERLLLENLDRRKSTGRTVRELSEWFERLPNARFCLDVGHACQIDPTLLEACSLLDAYGERLVQVHVSHVNLASRHERISSEIKHALEVLGPRIRRAAAIILESTCSTPKTVAQELNLVREVLRAA